MAQDYTDREIVMINALLKKMVKLNSLSEKVVEDIDETTIVQIGNNAEEKLFLLNVLLDDIIKEKRLNADNISTLNENIVNLTKSLKRTERQELVYTVHIPQIPGVEIPCSSLFEAKRVANSMIFRAKVLYNNQVVL